MGVKSKLSTALHWLAWLILANAALVLFVRFFGILEIPPYVQLVVFPEWVAGSLVVAAVIELFRKHAELVAAHCIAIALILLANPNMKSEWPVTTVGVEMNVLTANIKLGQGIDSLVELIERENPDLVFVQECDQACADALSSKSIRKQFRHQLLDPKPNSAGAAILSVYPFSLPTELFRPQALGTEFSMPEAILDVPEVGTIAVKSAHPFPPVPQQERLWSSGLQALSKFAMHYGSMPVVVAGDFNAGVEHKQFRDVMDSGRLRDAATELGIDKVTWSMDGQPYVQATIDHILFSSGTARAYMVFPLDGSDHQALLATIRL